VPPLYDAGRFARVPVWLTGADAAGADGNTGGSLGNLWSVIAAVALFVVMIVGSLLLLRLLSRGGLGRQSRYLRVLDRFPISRDCQILVLSVGARVLVVSVGRDGGGLLCELDPAELDLKAAAKPAAPSEKDGASERSTFGGRFWHNIKLNAGIMPKGTKPMGPSPKERPGDADTEAFAAILDAVRRQAGEEAADTADESSDSVSRADNAGRINNTGGAADYRAAVENMRRLAQTDRTAPASRPGSLSTPVPSGRGGDSDEDTARELLRVLQERGGQHERGKPAHTKTAPRDPRDGAIDDILDSIAKRQSRYTSGQQRPGQGKGKDRS
jgi:flagellar biogenesis protein FliO